MTEQINPGTVALEAAVPTKRIMDKELYEKLKDMFYSSDKGNYPIAEQILIDCDIEKSIYYMWKLLKNDGIIYKLNRRLKKIRNFIDMPHIRAISYKSLYNFVFYIKTEKLLTPEIWTIVESDITKMVKLKCVNDFYDVELKLRDLYA